MQRLAAVFLLPTSLLAAEPQMTEVTPKGSDVVIIGDFGTGNQDQYDVAKGIEIFCRTHGCDYGVTVGDNFYPKGVRSVDDPQFQTAFEHPYGHLGFTFYPAYGNHDYLGNREAQLAYKSDAWQMPGRFYKLSTPNADLFAIDTEMFDHAQRGLLEQAVSQSKKPWKLIYGHRPLHSEGEHGGNPVIKAMIEPILKAYAVDFYAAGHDHSLQLIEMYGEHTVHIGSGAAGKMAWVRKGKHTVFAKATMGFVHVDFEPASATLSYVDRYGREMFSKTYKKL